MALNIKDEQTHELVRELAERTGVSQAAAVRNAVEAQLLKLHRAELKTKWMEIIKDTGPRFGEYLSSETMDELLYDENGLPK